MTLQEFLYQILGIGGATGALSYPVAWWIFRQIDLAPATKRWAAYFISFGLAALAWLVVWLFGYADVTPDAVFASMTAAFSTSQVLHAAIELDKERAE